MTIANVEDYRAQGMSDTATITAAFNAINEKPAGDTFALYFDARIYVINGLLPAITTRDVLISGRSSGTILSIPANVNNYAGMGRFFTFGSSSATAINVKVEGFRLSIAKTLPNVDVFAVAFDQANGCVVENIEFDGLAGLIRYGTNTTASVRCTARYWNGTANQGLNSPANILVRNGAVGTFEHILASGTSDAGSTAPGTAIVRIEPVQGGSVDTFWFERVSTQFFKNESAPQDAGGKPYGVHVNRNMAPVTNLWFTDCVFDHTGEIAFYWDGDTAGAVSEDIFSRFVEVKGCRFATERGIGIKIDNSGGAILRGMKFDNNVVYVGTNSPAFWLLAPDVTVDVAASNNSFLHIAPTAAGYATSAVILNASGWQVSNNKVGSGSASTNKIWNTAILIQNSASNFFLLGPNLAQANMQYLTQPGSYTVNPGNRWIETRPT